MSEHKTVMRKVDIETFYIELLSTEEMQEDKDMNNN